MKYRNFSFATLVMAVLALAAGLSSCKENIAIHSNLTAAGDNIGTDTLVIADSNLVLKTILDDSLQTSTKSAGYTVIHALGWLKEPADARNPYPSNMEGNVFLQFVPTTTGFTFTSTDVIDSAVITMPYAGFSWGDTTVRDQQIVTAYRLDDTMSVNSIYYNYSTKAATTAVSAPVSFYTGRAGTGVIGDSITLNKIGKVAPQLRVRLNQTELDRIKTIVARQHTTYDSFLTDLKGYCIKSSTLGNGKAMPYFTVYGSGTSGYYNQSNLIVYAHPSTTDTTVTTYQFPFNTTYTGHFNQIKRTYSNTSIFNDPNHPYIMIQNQPGAAVDLVLKNLRLLDAVKGNVVINKVQLVFTEINEFRYPDSIYTHPNRIYPIGIDGVNVRYSIVDRYDDYASRYLNTTNGQVFIDGTPVVNSNTNYTTYSINFPREFQRSIIQQKSELHLRINGTLTFPGAYRLIAGNRTNPNANYRYALRIIYSKQQ